MNAKRTYLALLLFAPLPLLQACGDAGAWEGTVVDSAGVAVVHNPATPLWRSGEEWTVTEDLKIGTMAGEPEYQFGQVFFLDVGPDGSIYVADFQTTEVKAYDANGQHLFTIGTKGSGPGELQQVQFAIADPHGGVIVPDLGNQRVNRYDASGAFVGSFPIDIRSGVPARWMTDPSGRLLAQLRGLNLQGMAALAGGDPIVVLDTTGTVVDTVAVLPQGKTLEGMTEESLSIKIFAPEPVWDIDQDGNIVYAMNDQFRVLVNSPDGALQRVITKEVTPKPVEESDQNAILRLMREQYATLGVPPAQLEAILGGIGFAEFYPAFGQLFVGPGGTLWAQRIRSARDMAGAAGEEVEFDPQAIGSPEWDVFDDQGRWLGVVTLPDRFQPVDVRGDQIYGIWRDELDVQYVMRVRVNQPA